MPKTWKNPPRIISPAELAEHTSRKSCWILIDRKIYDVTVYLRKHPAGEAFILKYGGKDATDAFFGISRGSHSHSDVANSILARYHIGDLQEG